MPDPVLSDTERDDRLLAREARSPAEIERALALRLEVFCDEQGVDRGAELDGLDDAAIHIVALAGDRLVATCRLLPESSGCLRLGRMAVARSMRRSGVGRALIAAAEAAAAAAGASEVVLSAQRRAEGFYAACGYEPEGEAFTEESIPHVAMRKRLS